jgi:hypothetical protein
MKKTVNVLMVIDTRSLMTDYPDPSPNSSRPTLVSGHYAYVIVAGDSKMFGKTAGALNIAANVDDAIRWRAVSESNNFESSVLAYGIAEARAHQTLEKPFFAVSAGDSARPTQDGPFPVTFPTQTFWFLQSDIKRLGSQKCTIQFGVYESAIGSDQPAYGYFQCVQRLKITAEASDPS